ncbi:hypothetical protein ACPXB3_21360 [Gordonia sp. DT219]|uniref:hypothetical protein n=1 Tax=Gordonia sp. DT219 TaxID=3416658 RepID=UPI003CEE7FCE
MARLQHLEQGTVVGVGDDLELTYRARGWVDVDGEKKSPRRRRSQNGGGDASGHDHD